MAKATAKLEQRKDSKTGLVRENNVPILIDFTFSGKRLWIQTGISIDRKNWDQKNHRIKSSVINSMELNAVIQKKVSEIEKVYLDAKINNVDVTTAYIRNVLNQVKTSNKKNFWEYYEEYINNVKLKCAKNTLKKHRTSYDLLKRFSTTNRIAIDFDFIDTEFYQKYVEFLMIKMNHSNVTIAKYTQTLKQFLNYCSQRAYNKNMVYKTFSFSAKEPEIVALKKDEILSIKNLDLSKNKYLDQVRDCFLFLCFTALRYSDAANLKKNNVCYDSLNYTSVKTKTPVSVPLHPSALEIIEKYKSNNSDKLLPFISNQKMNGHLKELGKLANLNRDVVKVKYYGPERREFPRKLYEVLTTHIGRKSFISHLFNQGMDSELIRSLSNHKSISSFARYNKIEPSFQKAQLLEKFDI
ncbi:site-specific integrase [Sphingobacterium sp. FBM7-1]|uniref:site-specific integrase n=1 Tax=Sphingobacterium sp. FBM7-1 TaxID=2886688 RepID=UPI001D108178|nr:site-specific integrase [Sphingobacterium sp. FBM7-1]MCC2599778.1 site-specific integrase [Sphingobacterium sp. FBM7-1]